MVAAASTEQKKLEFPPAMESPDTWGEAWEIYRAVGSHPHWYQSGDPQFLEETRASSSFLGSCFYQQFDANALLNMRDPRQSRMRSECESLLRSLKMLQRTSLKRRSMRIIRTGTGLVQSGIQRVFGAGTAAAPAYEQEEAVEA